MYNLKGRTLIDYRTKYLYQESPCINKSSFTEKESVQILASLLKYDGSPPWHIVAKDLQTSRTPFQCFHHAQTKLTKSSVNLNSDLPLSMDVIDELLLKLIAASGPKLILNYHSGTWLTQYFFPEYSQNQILHKSNISLINPQLINERWSETEERTLALSMKIFDGEAFIMSKAGLLFNRSMKSVSDKWSRSVNPIYSTQPYTVEEDKALHTAIEKADPLTDDWRSISEQFPTRNPRSLFYRWVELAKERNLSYSGGFIIPVQRG